MKYSTNKQLSDSVEYLDNEISFFLKAEFAKEHHKGIIFRLSWSNDGSKILVPSQDKTVSIWKLDQNKEDIDLLRVLKGGHLDEINCAVFSPDDRLIATGSDDACIVIWNADNGSVIHKFQQHKDEVNEVSWSKDGRYLVSCSDDKNICVYDIERLQCIFTQKIHRQTIWSIDWSHKNSWIITGSDDQNVLLLDPFRKDSQQMREFPMKHSSSVRVVRWINEHTAVSGGRDGILVFWDSRSMEAINQVSAHAGHLISSIDVCVKGNILASKGTDAVVKIWDISDINSITLVQTLVEHPSKSWSSGVKFSPYNSRFLATLGHDGLSVRIWEREDKPKAISNSELDVLSDLDVYERYPETTHKIEKRPSVFISYSHKDDSFFKELKTMLKPLEKKHDIKCWSDKELSVGDNWKSRIFEEIDNADMIILIISKEFLASDFILDEEFPQIMQNKAAKKAWLLLNLCNWEMKDELIQWQAFHDVKSPLSSLEQEEKDKVLLSISKQICSLLV